MEPKPTIRSALGEDANLREVIHYLCDVERFPRSAAVLLEELAERRDELPGRIKCVSSSNLEKRVESLVRNYDGPRSVTPEYEFLNRIKAQLVDAAAEGRLAPEDGQPQDRGRARQGGQR
jgi:hypothetical protein